MKIARRRLSPVSTLAAVLVLSGCGSEQSKVERGLETGDDVAVPESQEQMNMTGAERRAAEIAAEEDATEEDEKAKQKDEEQAATN